MDEAKVARQEFDDGKTLLVMFTEGECSSSRLRDNNNFGNSAETCHNRLRKDRNRLHVEENRTVAVRE